MTFTDGVGSVLIGDTTGLTCASGSAATMPATLFNSSEIYLGVTVDADSEMTPRKRIVSTGYAQNADRLDDLETSAVGGTEAFVPVTDSSGLFTLTGTPTTVAGVITVNPSSPAANSLLLDLKNTGSRVFSIDADGDFTASGNATIAGGIDSGSYGRFGNLRTSFVDSSALYLGNESVITSGSEYGSFSTLYANPAATSAGKFYGTHVEVRTNAAEAVSFTNKIIAGSFGAYHLGTGSMNMMYGFQGTAYNTASGLVTSATGVAGGVTGSSSGNITNAYGLRSESSFTSTGDVGNLYNIYAANPTKTIDNTITANYGLYIEDQTAGDTNYAIFTAGTAPSSLGGDLFIGGSATVAGRLVVGDGTEQLASYGAVLEVGQTFTGSSDGLGTIDASMIYDPSTTSSASAFSFVGVTKVPSGNTQNISGTVAGGTIVAEHAGSGSMPFLVGNFIGANQKGSGSITTMIGSDANVNSFGSTGSVTTIYGIRSTVGIYSGHSATSVHHLYANDGDSSGTITNKSGLTVEEMTGATNNVDLLIGTSTIPSGNWALYSASTRPSSLAGSLYSSGLYPNMDDTYDLGTSSLRWRDLYLGPQTLHIGTSTDDEGTISYDTTNNVLNFSTDATTAGDIAFFGDDLYIDRSTGNISMGTATISGSAFIPLDIRRESTGTAAVSFTNPSSVGAASFFLSSEDPTTSTHFTELFNAGPGSPGSYLFDQPSSGSVITGTDNIGGLNLIAANASAPIKFATGGYALANERMRIDSSGNVGIGDTTPAALLTVGNGDLFQVSSAGSIYSAGSATIAGTVNMVSGTLQVDASSSRVRFGSLTDAPSTAKVYIGDSSNYSQLYIDTAYSGGDALHVFNDGVSTNSFGANIVSTNGTGLYANGGTYSIYTGATQSYFGGNVGIGDSSPEARLDVRGAGATEGIIIDATATDGDAYLQFQNNGSSVFTMGFDDGDADKFKIGTTAIGTNTRLTIDASGNVGIGNTAPGSTLDVVGTSSLTSSATTTDAFTVTANSLTAGDAIYVSSTTSGCTAGCSLVHANFNPTLNFSATGYAANFEYANAGTNASYGYGVRIDNVRGGAISSGTDETGGIWVTSQNTQANSGTTYVYGGIFTATGTVAGTSTAYGGTFTASGADTNYGVFSNGVGSGNYDFYASAADGSTAYGQSSSIRWKRNIVEIPNALDMVLGMRGVYYNWDEEHGGRHDMGMIAEEVMAYVPEIVAIDKNAPGYATGMDYGHLTPVLLQAIKNLYDVSLVTDGAGDYVIAPATAASASVPAVYSAGLSLRSSWWNDGTVTAEDSEFKIVNEVSEQGAGRLAFLNDGGVTAMSVSQDGDLSIKGRLYLSDRGAMQSDAYLYYDSSSPLGGYVRTNAAGFGTGSYDFAETFPSDDDLKAGELVMIDVRADEKVTRANNSSRTNGYLLAGIVSTRPGFLAGVTDVGNYPVALQGRVPTKVNLENGPIRIGDPIAISSTPGEGMKANSKNYVVGIALQNFNPSTGSGRAGNGMITVFLKVGWYNGETVEAQTQSLAGTITTEITGAVDFKSQPLIGIGAMEGVDGRWSIDSEGNLVTSEIRADKVTTKKAAVEVDDDIQTAGRSVILTGNSEVRVENAAVTPNSMIFVTFYGGVGGDWWISEKTDGAFTVKLSVLAATDLQFEYWVVDIEDNRTVVPEVQTQEDLDAAESDAPVQAPATVSASGPEEPTGSGEEPATVTEGDVQETAPEQVTESEAPVEEPATIAVDSEAPVEEPATAS